MKLKTIVAAVVLAFGAVAAQAASIPDLGPTALTGTRSVTGSFTDYINFNVVSSYNMVGGNVSDLSVYNLLNITGLTVSLFDEIEGGGSLVSPVLGGQDSYEFSGFLATGDYSLKVTGNATGTYGGAYTYLAFAQAVPEPETYAMFLAGLGLMGFMSRRRSIK